MPEIEQTDILKEADVLCGLPTSNGNSIILSSISSRSAILPAVIAEARRLEAELARTNQFLQDIDSWWEMQCQKISASEAAKWKAIAVEERATLLTFSAIISPPMPEELVAFYFNNARSDHGGKSRQAARELESEIGEHFRDATKKVRLTDSLEAANACDDWGNQVKLSTSGGSCKTYTKIELKTECKDHIGEANEMVEHVLDRGRLSRWVRTIELTPERREAIMRLIQPIEMLLVDHDTDSDIEDAVKILRSMLAEAGECQKTTS